MRAAWPLVFGLSGALVVWGASQLLPDRYTSNALLRINVEPFPAADLINYAWQETVSRPTLKRLIERFNLYPEERERLPLEDVMDNAKQDDMAIAIHSNLDVLVTFAYRDPSTAKVVTTALVEALVAASRERARTEPGWGNLEVTQPVVVEKVSTGLAFWKPSRYVGKGPLVPHQLHNFKFDPRIALQRAQQIKIDAFTQLRYSVESYGSLNELSRHLQIDIKGNLLVIKRAESDPKRAQRIASQLITGVVDDNDPMPHCPGPPLVGTSNLPKTNPPRLAPGAVPPGIALVGDLVVTPLQSESASEGVFHNPSKLGPPLVAKTDCRDPITPAWARTITVLNPASLPETPDGPSRPILTTFGFFLGLGLWTATRGR